MLVCFICVFFERFKIDDFVSCVFIYGLVGIWGLLVVGLFVEKDILECIFFNEFGFFKGGFWKFVGV